MTAARKRASGASANQMSLFAPPRPGSVVPCRVEREVYQDQFLRYHATTLDEAGEELLLLDKLTWDHDAHGAVGLDVESFINYFVICFKRFADGKRLAFELSDRSPELPVADIVRILTNNTIITFNGLQYDFPIVYAALQGKDTIALKAITEQLIFGGIKPWEVERRLGIRVPRQIQHIDLMEPNPAVRQGLKILHGRLHGRFMVDLPFEINDVLTHRQMNIATLYCHNDLDA